MEDRGMLLPQGGLAEGDQSTEKMECDLDLIIRAKDGDKDAFSLLFMKTYRRMYFVAKSFLSNDEDIYDALQNGYAKAYKYIHRLDPPEKFLPWLIKIIQNAAKDVRSHAQEYVIGDEVQQIADRDVTSDAERRADMQDVLSRMDPKQAEVLVRYYYDGMKLADIAKLLDEPASTVRSRFKAAKKEILELLKTKDIDSSLYSGSISTMIGVALRSVIGTDILSAVVAQQMLDGILGDGKLNKAAFHLIEQRRNRSVLHLATILLLTCVGVAAIVTLLVLWLTGSGKNGSVDLPWQPVSSTSSDTTTWQQAAMGTGSESSLDQTTTVAVNLPTTGPMIGPALPPTWTTTTAFYGGSGTTGQTYWPVAGTTTKTPPRTTTKYTTTTTRKATTAASKPFQSDYRAGYANTIGNSGNNICTNRGMVAKQDQWLYYAIDNVLYKVKADGAGHQLVAECPGEILFVNVVGDWIYMLSQSDYYGNTFYRCRTDGSLPEILSDDYLPVYLQVVEDTAYFSNGNGTLRKWGMTSDSTPTNLKPEYYVGYFWVNGDYIVFPCSNEEILITHSPSMGILSLSSGKFLRVYSSFEQDYLMDGNLVYARNDSGYLVSIDYTATNPQSTIKTLGPASTNLCFALDGVIGYSTVSSGYGRPELVSTSGKSVSNYWPSDIKVSLDDLYTFDDGYVYTFTEDGTLCRAKPNGSEFKKIT